MDVEKGEEWQEDDCWGDYLYYVYVQIVKVVVDFQCVVLFCFGEKEIDIFYVGSKICFGKIVQQCNNNKYLEWSSNILDCYF